MFLPSIELELIKARVADLSDVGDRQHGAFDDHLVVDHGQRGSNVADGHGERAAIGAAVVVADRDRDGVEAVVGVGVRAVERRQCRHAGAARVDRAGAGIERRAVAPIDASR